MRSDAELEAALALRVAVFAGEQGVPVAIARDGGDGRDGDAINVIASEDGAVTGALRMLVESGVGGIGHVVVEASRRRQGVATAMLEAAERIAAREGANRLVLQAQTGAIDLYVRAGFAPRGPVFEQQGIPHVAMEKRLG